MYGFVRLSECLGVWVCVCYFRTLAKINNLEMTFVDLIFVIENRDCENCTPWPWPTFSISHAKNETWNSFIFISCLRAKIMKISVTHIQIFTIDRRKARLLLRNLDLHFLFFDFKLLKICEIRSFSYVSLSWNYEKISNTHSNICNQTAKEACFFSLNLTYILEFKHLKYLYLWNGKS